MHDVAAIFPATVLATEVSRVGRARPKPELEFQRESHFSYL
jgi:hypothetical protein